MAAPQEVSTAEIVILVEGAIIPGEAGETSRRLLERLLYADIPESTVALDIVRHPGNYDIEEPMTEEVLSLVPLAKAEEAIAAPAELTRDERRIFMENKPLIEELYNELLSESRRARLHAENYIETLRKVPDLRRAAASTDNRVRAMAIGELGRIRSPPGNSAISVILDAFGDPGKYGLRVVSEKPPPGRPPVTAPRRGRPPGVTIRPGVVSITEQPAAPGPRILLPRERIAVFPQSIGLVRQAQLAKRISGDEYRSLVLVYRATYTNPNITEQTRRQVGMALVALGEEVPELHS